MSIDYYGNITDNSGNLVGTNYYESQSWIEQKAANDAQQAAVDAASALADAAEQARRSGQRDLQLEAAANVAAAAVGKAVQAYERVGGSYPDHAVNNAYAQEAVTQANVARKAAGLPALPAVKRLDDVMTPGVPGGPIDTPHPVPRNPSPAPSWQVNQGGLGGILQLLTVGTLATQLLRWLGGK